MKYVDEFRSQKLIRKVAEKIKLFAPDKEVNIMEVCGTHTQNFRRFGLGKFLPPGINFISGPGCPVCVSAQEYIDRAIAYCSDKGNIVLSFGDMLGVPGTVSSLEKERAKGANVRVAYSALDALRAAAQNPGKNVLFLAVGFETTAPTIALTILRAKKENLKNIFFLSSLKLIPPAMKYLLEDERLKLFGFLCPGHVSAIIGCKPYANIVQKYGISCCVAGFEPLDILEGIYFLLKQAKKKRPALLNQYQRVVAQNGNPKAREIIKEVFQVTCANWRGLGKIPESGLKLRREFSGFDAEASLPVQYRPLGISAAQKRCRCGDILKGLIRPDECRLFRKICSPQNPVGPCMVSNEGACNAYYKYR